MLSCIPAGTKSGKAEIPELTTHRPNLSAGWIPPGGGTLPYKPYRYVSPKRVGFFVLFGLKTGIHFAHFGLESGMVFEGTTGEYECIYRFNSKGIKTK